MTVKSTLTAAVLTILAGLNTASAAVIAVSSYDMPNGYGTENLGTYNYWDATYNGAGATTTDGAPLSGGTGALTNGVIATQGYGTVSNAFGTGQYVGWKYTDPLITFHLANLSTVSSLSLFVDNSYEGLVGAPATVTVNGINYNPIVTHPFGAGNPAIQLVIAFAAPITASLFTVTPHAGGYGPDVLAYNLLYPGDPITGGKEPWMMISEIQFNGVSAVPELSTWAMMLIGFSVFGFVAYRRKVTRNPVPAQA